MTPYLVHQSQVPPPAFARTHRWNVALWAVEAVEDAIYPWEHDLPVGTLWGEP